VPDLAKKVIVNKPVRGMLVGFRYSNHPTELKSIIIGFSETMLATYHNLPLSVLVTLL
jgi:hypothetical protein